MVKFSDIEDAFLFVSSDSYGMHSAILDQKSGQIYYRSERGDIDDISEADLDWEVCIDIPHRNDLGLGQQLVFEFVEMYLPEEYQRVEHFFRRRGAYRRYKNLLDSKGLLQRWYDFENQHEEKALREWCEDNEIALVE